MSDITIVTAFFDIGRGNWTEDKGFPSYLKRDTKTYMERFARMAKLENPMVIYTTSDLADEISNLREDRPTHILTLDFDDYFVDLKQKIREIQEDVNFQKLIHPSQKMNPEYWNSDYVLINMLKSMFVRMAYQEEIIKTELAAWIDFGYCRNEDTLHDLKEWKYDFESDKVHVFTLRDLQNIDVLRNICYNIVYLTGPCIISGKDSWYKLENLMLSNFHHLLNNNLIDDDQGVLTMCYINNPELFKVHRLNGIDWFIVFKEYSK